MSCMTYSMKIVAEITNIIAVDRVQKNILDVFISGFTKDPKQNIRLIGNKK